MILQGRSFFWCLGEGLWPTTKNKKKHWLKRPKAVPKKTNLDQNINDSKSHIVIVFSKILFRHTQFFYIRLHVPGHHQSIFFDFGFSSRKTQSQQKLAKKTTHFTIQFCSKKPTHLTNLNSFDIENNMLPKHSQKPCSLYKFSSKHVFVWCQNIGVLYNFFCAAHCLGLVKCLALFHFN